MEHLEAHQYGGPSIHLHLLCRSCGYQEAMPGRVATMSELRDAIDDQAHQDWRGQQGGESGE